MRKHASEFPWQWAHREKIVPIGEKPSQETMARYKRRQPTAPKRREPTAPKGLAIGETPRNKKPVESLPPRRLARAKPTPKKATTPKAVRTTYKSAAAEVLDQYSTRTRKLRESDEEPRPRQPSGPPPQSLLRYYRKKALEEAQREQADGEEDWDDPPMQSLPPARKSLPPAQARVRHSTAAAAASSSSQGCDTRPPMRPLAPRIAEQKGKKLEPEEMRRIRRSLSVMIKKKVKTRRMRDTPKPSIIGLASVA